MADMTAATAEYTATGCSKNRLNNMNISQEKTTETFSMDRETLTEFIGGIMNAPEGTYAYKVRDDWAEFAVSINSDKLYESAE